MQGPTLRQCIGLMEAVRAFAQLETTDLEALKEQVKSVVTEDFSNVWELGMNTINLDFMCTIIRIFKECLLKVA